MLKNNKLVIEYYKKGGNLPYQAEGKINDRYFYFRARHDYCSLEIYNNIKDLDNLSDHIICVTIKEGSFLNNEEADIIIRKLWYLIKNSEWIK